VKVFREAAREILDEQAKRMKATSWNFFTRAAHIILQNTTSRTSTEPERKPHKTQ
jgi:hypothetical protein